MDLRRFVMAQPEDQRLETALAIIEDLSGQFGAAVLQRVFRLTRAEAVMLAAINARAPELVSHDALATVLWGPWAEERDPAGVKVYVARLRRKLAGSGHEILCVWGHGYHLSSPIEMGGLKALPPEPVTAVVTPLHSSPARDAAASGVMRWSAQEDAELIRMRANGSEWWAIAEEMERSEDSCIRRWKRLHRRRAVQAVAA